MPRRLLDQDPRREQRRQALLIERISRTYERQIAKEITATTRALVKKWERSGQVAVPEEHQRNIQALLEGTWGTAIRTLGKRIDDAAKQRGLPDTIKSTNEFFQFAQLQYFLTIGGEKIAEDIARTTVDQIMAQVALGRREGLGQADISERINTRASAIGLHRGAVIARTETHSAGNFGVIETAKQTGLPMQKEWISADDEQRTREDHRDADEQTVGLDDAFSVGGESLMYPGDMANGSAGNVINCRCAQGMVVLD